MSYKQFVIIIMMSKSIKTICWCFGLWGFVLSAASWGMPIEELIPRGVAWRQIHSEHFIVIFAGRHREIAQQVALTAEAVHAAFAQFFNVQNEATTNVILTDQSDTFPLDDLPGIDDPTAVVLSLGEPEHAANLAVSQDWLTRQFILQYAAIFRHEQDTVLRRTTSRLLPDVGFSGWYEHGMAAYLAAKLAGQPSSPLLEMLMRTDVIENSVAELEQRAAKGVRDFPQNLGRAFYGYDFLRYLAKTYGEPTLAELANKQHAIIPWSPFGRDVFEKTYEKNLSALQTEWRNSLLAEYQQQLIALQSSPLTVSDRLSHSGYWTNAPLFSPDGEFVYYIEDSASQQTTLAQVRLSDGRETPLTTGKFSGSFSISADGRQIFFSKTERYHVYYEISDLYLLDLATNRVTRLTTGARAFDPAIAPDGNRLVYVSKQTGKSELWQFDLANRQASPLFMNADITQMRHPSFSPDGANIAVQIATRDGFRDIYVMKSDGTGMTPITHDAAAESSPSWSADGKYLFFASDRTGVSNIFAYALDNQTLAQVTNVLTGAFEPSVSPDGSQLAFAEYSGSGFDIHLARLDAAQWNFQTPTAQDRSASTEKRLLETAALPETSYQVFSELLQPGISPIGGEDEDGVQLGVVAYSFDTLKRHTYSLAGLYGIVSGRFAYRADYINTQFFPTIHLYGYDTAKVYEDVFYNYEGKIKDYWERQRGFGVDAAIPLYRTLRSDLYLIAGYEYQKLTALTNRNKFIGNRPDDGIRGAVSGAIFWQSLAASRYAISPESGASVRLEYQRDDEIFGSDFNINTGIGEVNAYLKTPFRHHVLALRTAGGISDGETLTQGVFQLGGYTINFSTDPLFEPQYFLRGYKKNAVAGDRFLLGTAEYRFPIWFPQSTIWGGRILLDNIAGKAFVEAGDAWENQMEDTKLKASIGGEVSVQLGWRYGRIPVKFAVGFARGLDKDRGESQVYFTVGL